MGKGKQTTGHFTTPPPDKDVVTGFTLPRRTFLQILGSGVLITVADPIALTQLAGATLPVAARIHLNKDGTITAMSGKVEEGQGPRAELSQAAAEELRVPVNQIRLVMADTDLVPDDGITAGSRTTPRNVPEMRQAAATARQLLTNSAADQWKVDLSTLKVRNGTIRNPTNGQTMTYADLAKSKDLARLFAENVQPDVAVSPVAEWKILGQSVPRPNSRDLVTGAHRFPSDIVRPNMLYGKVLRPPSYGATLKSIDLSAAKAMKGVVAIHDGQFVGFAAPSTHRAEQALDAAAKTASWITESHAVSNRNLHAHLKEHAKTEQARTDEQGSVERGFSEGEEVISATYTLAYVQHAPMEPRAAVAEWSGEKLTVWAGCDGPFRAQSALTEEFGISPDQVRVIIPDMGGGFGGKHTVEAGLEAARLAKAAGRPVWRRWTREEEFTWAYSRPAAVIECKGGLRPDGALTAWEFTNINAGGSAIATPYAIPNTRITSVSSDSPIRQGSYRCLGATGNNFARESFMDELAATAEADPLDFRMAHLENPRLRAVLKEATDHFKWTERRKKITPELGIGLACGTEKNSVVAACVLVEINRGQGSFRVLEVCEAFECGPILNPSNLTSQVQGCIIMGLGGALTEEILFEEGKIRNAAFSRYRAPRFRDVPKIEVHLVENPDIPAAGGGETPIIAVAPAIGNAIFAATGVRIRSMPIQGELLSENSTI